MFYLTCLDIACERTLLPKFVMRNGFHLSGLKEGKRYSISIESCYGVYMVHTLNALRELYSHPNVNASSVAIICPQAYFPNEERQEP